MQHKSRMFRSCWQAVLKAYPKVFRAFCKIVSTTQNVMPRLSLADRHQAIGMLQAGMSQGEVAAHTFSDTETPFQHW
jgi:hypothetical protein